jgi:hypothetical protein
VLYQQLSLRKIDENLKPVSNSRNQEEKELMSSHHVHVVSHVWRNRQPEPDPRMPPSYSAVAKKGRVKDKEGSKDTDYNEEEEELWFRKDVFHCRWRVFR